MADKSLEEAKADISTKVYAVVAPIFEALEHAKLIHGNGHHMAQRVAAEAEKLVQERWKK